MMLSCGGKERWIVYCKSALKWAQVLIDGMF